MRIDVAVHDLSVENCNLMPWRTACEIIKYLRTEGHDARLLSLGGKAGGLHGGIIPEGAREIPKRSARLKKELDRRYTQDRPKVIFWPVSWRESVARLKIVTNLGVPVVLWQPGGAYDFSACIYSLLHVGIRRTLPYLREALCNKKEQVGRFRRLGVRSIITMTKVSAGVAISAGWDGDRVYVIPPGRSEGTRQPRVWNLTESFRKALGGTPYFLYLGPPGRIRGVYELLRAFEGVAEELKDVRLVCLFRSDNSVEKGWLVKFIQGLSSQERILCDWGWVPRETLNGLMGSCHAVVMPFVLVPSEIPLGIIESMGFGKPVITTSSGGTGTFVSQFGMTAPVGDVSALIYAMIRLVKDTDFYSERCLLTRKAYEEHPTWQKVGTKWLQIAEIASKHEIGIVPSR
jgi:glycosyltransferase involved in cell wall biosynthesis